MLISPHVDIDQSRQPASFMVLAIDRRFLFMSGNGPSVPTCQASEVVFRGSEGKLQTMPRAPTEDEASLLFHVFEKQLTPIFSIFWCGEPGGGEQHEVVLLPSSFVRRDWSAGWRRAATE